MEPMHDKVGAPSSGSDPQNDELSAVWAAYRRAVPEADANADFMPNLWRKIEAKRSESVSIFRRFAHICMAATAALLLLTFLLTPAMQDDDDLYSSTYAEVLANEHADSAYVEALPAELPEAAR
jgi:hypothetical protein